MVRKCKCSGGCCGPQTDEVSRRGFLTVIGAGAATAAVGAPGMGRLAPDPLLARGAWLAGRRPSCSPSPVRVYRSGVHTDARMHLGGIGTGNIEIGCDGQFTRWLLFNTLPGTPACGFVPLMFAVKAGDATRLLQTAGGPDWPRVKQIEMIGEYPIATLKFVDADLPVKLQLSAFTPFAPLDSRFSSMPLAALVFRVQNPTDKKQTISLAALMQNPVGYDAMGAAIDGVTHDKFAGNVNEPLGDGKAVGLTMRAEPGKDPTLDKPVKLFVGENLAPLAQMADECPKTLAVTVMENNQPPAPNAAEGARDVIWFEEPTIDTSEATLAAAKKAVEAGATLVFSGKSLPLLALYARSERPATRPDVVFEDFEHGYDKWKVEGDAFGSQPATGTLPNQNTVTGFKGKGLVNSFVGGDDATGKLVSQPFTIKRNFIRFLIGGGSHPTTQIRLIVGGKVVRASSGHDDERPHVRAVGRSRVRRKKSPHRDRRSTERGRGGTSTSTRSNSPIRY